MAWIGNKIEEVQDGARWDYGQVSEGWCGIDSGPLSKILERGVQDQFVNLSVVLGQDILLTLVFWVCLYL